MCGSILKSIIYSTITTLHWGLLCQNQISRTGTCNYIPRNLWDVMTWPCPCNLLLAHKSAKTSLEKSISSYVKWKGTKERKSSVCDCPKGRYGLILARHIRGEDYQSPFVNFSVRKIFILAKVPLGFESHLYLTDASAAEMRRHLLHTNVIFNS